MPFYRNLLLVSIVGFNFIYSQQGKIEHVRNEDNSVTFSYNKNTPGSAFIILKFPSLTNARSGIVKKQITGYGSTLKTLQPIDKSRGIGFSTQSISIMGNVKAKPDTDFRYTFPFSNGKEVLVRSLRNLNDAYADNSPNSWRGFQFIAKAGDTIRAIRKGEVIEIINDFNEDKDLEYNFKSESNSIIIEHQDGTLAKYSVLKKDSFMVNVGDTVYPTSPLALAGTYDKVTNSQVRLFVYYLNDNAYDIEFNHTQTMSNQTYYYSYIDPFFAIDSKDSSKLKDYDSYMSYLDDDLISAEMKKRELKKWKKGKLKI